MSNPAKTLKKVIKAVIVVAVVAAVAYMAWPAISAAVSGGAAGSTAAGGAAAQTAGAAANAAAANAAAAGATNAAAAGAATANAAAAGATQAAVAKGGAGLLGSMASNPMVQYGLVQAGTNAIAGAMEEEPQTEAEKTRELLEVYQSQPYTDRNYTTTVGSGYLPANAGTQYSAPVQASGTQTSGLLGRYNPETRRWEQTG